MVLEAFENAPRWISEAIAEKAKEIKGIVEINQHLAEGEKPRRSHYSETEKTIRMDSRIDPEEYQITFQHEMGHFIDDAKDRISLGENFYFSIEADKDQYNRGSEFGMENFERLLTELSENEDIMSNRYVSDILSAVFRNDTAVRKIYENNYQAFYGHDNWYWMEREGSVQKEIFANLFAIYTENNENSVNFVERNFPNIVSRFKKEMNADG